MQARKISAVILGLMVAAVITYAAGGGEEVAYLNNFDCSYTLVFNDGQDSIIYTPAYYQSDKPDSLNMRLAGFYGLRSGSYYIAIHDSYLYTPAGYGFVVFDVGTDPTSPVLVGTVTEAPWVSPTTLLPSGNYLYVTAYRSGLYTYDISDRKNPKRVDIHPLPLPCFRAYEAMMVNGVLCVLAVSSRDDEFGGRHVQLVIFSTDEPAHPVEIARLDLPVLTGLNRLAFDKIDTNLIVVGGSPSYLYIVNLTDPEEPVILDECRFSTNPNVIDLLYEAGDALYVTHSFLDTLTWDITECRFIYDMSDFSNPVVLDSQEVDHVPYWTGLLGKDTLMMTSFDTLYFFDISGPGELNTLAWWYKRRPAAGYIARILPQGELMYSGGVFWGLRVLDRTDLNNIEELWFGTAGAGSFNSISTPLQDKLYATAWNSTREGVGTHLYPFTVSSAGEIATADSLSMPLSNGRDLFRRGNLLGVGILNTGAVDFYDISEPDTLRLLGSVIVGDPERLFCDGNLCYVAGGDLVMSAIDFSDSTSPVFLAWKSIPGEGKDIWEKDGIVYVTGVRPDGGYLEIHRFSDAEFEELARIELEENGLGLYLVDNTLYLSRYDALEIFDVSDPTSPIRLGIAAAMLDGRNDDVVVLGDYAFVASDHELVSFNVSDPTSPILCGYYVIPEQAWWTTGLRQRLRTDGKYIFWSTRVYGLCVIEPLEGPGIAEDPRSSQNLSLCVDHGFGRAPVIRYTIPNSSDITLTVYGPAGRKVSTLYQGKVESGSHQISWNTSTIPAGVYFVRLDTGSHNLTARVVIVK